MPVSDQTAGSGKTRDRGTRHCNWNAPRLRPAVDEKARTANMTDALLAGLYLVAINLAAFWLFWVDKRAAIAGARRIPEDRLLAVAFLGGSIGAKIGQMALRHKIRKEPFRQQLNGILAVQILAMAAAYALWMLQRDMLWAVVRG